MHSFDFWFLLLILLKQIKFSLINQLDSNKSSGIYNFPIKLIKLASAQCLFLLVNYKNDSFENEYLPDKLKTQKIISLFKGGSGLSVTNYRPISLLTILKKIY